MERPETIESLLQGYRAEVLRQMADAVRLPEPINSKSKLVRMLARKIATRDYVEGAVSRLDEGEAATLDRVRRVGGIADWQALQGVLVAEGVVKATPHSRRSWYQGSPFRAGDPRDRSSRVFADVAARLALKGLLLAHGPLGSSTVVDFAPASRLVIPREIIPFLPPLTEPPVAIPHVAAEVLADAHAFSRDLFAIWSYFWHNEVTLLKSTELVPKRDLRALVPQLHEPLPDLGRLSREDEFLRLYFGRRLLEAGGMLAVTPDQRVVASIERARSHWEAPEAESARRLLALWRDGEWWNELKHLPSASWRASQSWTRDDNATVREARATLLDELIRLAAARDGWCSRTEFLANLRLARRDFLIAPLGSSSYAYWYGNDPPHRYAGTNRNSWTFTGIHSDEQGWNAVEAAMADLVLQVLSWLGLLDLGFGEKDELVAFRLTPLGRHLLLGEPLAPQAAAAGEGRIVLQPNFHLVAFGPVSPAILLELEQFADRLRIDRAIEYELTRASFYRAQRAGLDAGSVIDRLAALTVAEVPQNIARTLHEWQALHERIVLFPRVSLLQAATPDLLDPLEQANGVRRLAPLVAQVIDEGRVAAAMASTNLTPLVTASTESAHGVDLDGSGWVQFRSKVPDFYLLGRLQQLADYDEATGCWQLTAASVRRARARSGLTADDQLAAWRELLATAPPAWLAERIKVWSGYYGDARLERPVLLVLRDEQVLAALRADSRIAGLLKPFKPRRGVAEVAPEDLETLREILAEKGIDLTE